MRSNKNTYWVSTHSLAQPTNHTQVTRLKPNTVKAILIFEKAHFINGKKYLINSFLIDGHKTSIQLTTNMVSSLEILMAHSFEKIFIEKTQSQNGTNIMLKWALDI